MDLAPYCDGSSLLHRNALPNILTKQNKNSYDIIDKPLIKAESNNTSLNKLKELSLLKENGFITEEEFNAKKRDISDKMNV